MIHKCHIQIITTLGVTGNSVLDTLEFPQWEGDVSYGHIYKVKCPL